MDATHIHLLLNHFPIIGTLIGSVVLIWGFVKKQDNIKIVGCTLIVIMAIAAIPVFLTGEPAEEKVEDLPGVVETIIEEHEEAAEFAIWALGLTGLSAFLSLIGYRLRHKLVNASMTLTMILSLIGFVAMARTGYTGGQIRHTELRSGSVMQGDVQENDNRSESTGKGEKEENDD